MAKDASGENSCVDVAIRKRRRVHRQRHKVPRADQDYNSDESDAKNGDEGEHVGVSVLREAQRLREKSRKFSKNPSLGVSRLESVGGDDKAVEGLRQNFKNESSNVEIEKQMEDYIEERLANEFLTKKSGGDGVQQKWEDELYSIPSHLQVKPRPMYDPGEGLPVAGLEEVELGEANKNANVKQTEVARKALEVDRSTLVQETRQAKAKTEDSGSQRPAIVIPGNFSTDFHKHRHDFIEALNKQGGQSAAQNVASDAIVAERFKRRFRKR